VTTPPSERCFVHPVGRTIVLITISFASFDAVAVKS
jgi:hypothetical protein